MDDILPDDAFKRFCGPSDSDHDAIDERSKGVRQPEVGVIRRIKVHIYSRSYSPTACVSKHRDEFEALGEVANRVIDAAQALCAEHISSDSNDEEVVAILTEQQFDRGPGIGATQYDRERSLLGGGKIDHRNAEGHRVERNDQRFLRPVCLSMKLASDSFSDFHEEIVAFFENSRRLVGAVNIANHERLERIETINQIHT
jgi:hypothetical protein